MATTTPAGTPVKEAVRSRLGVTRYNHKGFSKNHFRCPDPQHEDPGPSANWHKDGFCHCFGCSKDFNAKEMAEFLDIPWRAQLGIQPQILSSDKIDLNAAPRQLETASAPLFFNEPPDSLLRLSNKVLLNDVFGTLLLCHTAAQRRSFARGFQRKRIT